MEKPPAAKDLALSSSQGVSPNGKPPLPPSPNKRVQSASDTRSPSPHTTSSSVQGAHLKPDPSVAATSQKSSAQKQAQDKAVKAALNAVLHKKEEGVRGLSVTPDPSLNKDKVNKDVLAKMRETFARADADGTGELSPEEFCTAFAGLLHTEDGSDSDALYKLFMRIDANSDGSVTWDEFCTYMLLESQGAANLRDLENSISFDDPVEWKPPEGCEHNKLITNITLATLPNGTERYVTCGRDGLVKVWNAKDFKLLRTIPVGHSWVTAAKMLPTTRKLAVTSFSRSMKIFDLQTYEICGQIQEIEYAPMAMDTWSPARQRDLELVAFGDGGGFVRLYELRLNPLEQKTSSDRYLETVRWKHQHHTDWVTCIKFVPELNAVVAGSLDKTISISDADDRVGVKALQGHFKGVSCVDWSPVYKFIVSGSQDRRAILWNPFSLKPLATLSGHVSGITAVCVNDRDNQIITLGADKHVKLWDIRNHKCIQTLTDREVVPGPEEKTLLCATYDHKQKSLITGALWPKAWKQTITASASCGHQEPVVRVLFNSLFNEAVSADAKGTISIWHVPTGKLRFRFGNTHPKQQLTALAFDNQKRRILTGADNGVVKVWNFSSGACLCTLHPRTHEEVTSIVAVRSAMFRHFVVSGWDRTITYYEDPGGNARETYAGRTMMGHRADILDMAVTGNNQLVSVSDDGEVCSWNLESGALRARRTPPGHADLPLNEQAIERIEFLTGRLQHVFVTVGADRWLRFWDSSTLDLLFEVFTGHMVGESVTALALHPDNTALATADASGIVKVWDISQFTGRSMYDNNPTDAEGEEMVVETAVWRAHKSSITSMEWLVMEEGEFLLTSSTDRTVSLWSTSGAFVGQFGACVWLLDTPTTWRATTAYDLDAKDTFNLSMSKEVPKRSSLIKAMSSRMSVMGIASPPMQAHASPCTVVDARGDMARAPHATASAGGAIGGSQSRPSTAMHGAAMQRDASPLSRPVSSNSRASPKPRQSMVSFSGAKAQAVNDLRMSKLSIPVGAIGSGGDGGGAHDSPQPSPSRMGRTVSLVAGAAVDACASPRAVSAGGCRVLSTQSPEPEPSHGPVSPRPAGELSHATSSRFGVTGEARATTAPDDIARVLVASHQNRLRHVKSLRLHERSEGSYTGQASEASSPRITLKSPSRHHPRTRQSATAQQRDSSDASLPWLAHHPARQSDDILRALEDDDPTTNNQQGRNGSHGSEGEDSSSEDLPSESSVSEAHTSDDDIPRALYLDEFKLARRAVPGASQGDGGLGQDGMRATGGAGALGGRARG